MEVLNPGNTAREMELKRHEYFAGGVRLVWYVDPEARRVEVFTDATTSTVLQEQDTLTGDPVLPGFVLPLRELFARVRR